MVTLNAFEAHMPDPDVRNIPHQHAFLLVGDKTFFAVHQTQFHCELHKYQLIFKVTLNGKDDDLRRLRRTYPREALFFCNGDDRESCWFSIPEIGCGDRTTLRGNIFVGLRRPPAAPKKDFFPWSLDRAKPAIADVTVTVERVVLFRPFVHHEPLPEYATFFVWGEGGEAHITNKQIAVMDSAPFEERAFGPGVDFLASLAALPAEEGERPRTPVDWLQDSILKAGAVVTIPSIRTRDAQTGAITIPPDPWVTEGEVYGALYRGVTPARPIVMGRVFMYCTAVINSPGRIPNLPPDEHDIWGIYEMPKKYWGAAP